MIVPDVNLLLCAHAYERRRASASPRPDTGGKSLTNGTERVGVPWVVAIGFVRLATHASVLAHPRSPAEAVDYVDEWFRLPHVTPLNPGRQHLTLVRHALEAAGVGGNLVTDAHIAALAMEYQAEVHSNDMRHSAASPGCAGVILSSPSQTRRPWRPQALVDSGYRAESRTTHPVWIRLRLPLTRARRIRG